MFTFGTIRLQIKNIVLNAAKATALYTLTFPAECSAMDGSGTSSVFSIVQIIMLFICTSAILALYLERHSKSRSKPLNDTADSSPLNSMSEEPKMYEMMEVIYKTTINGYVTFSTNNLKAVDCNSIMGQMLAVADRQQIIDNYLSFSPTYQPDGMLSEEKHKKVLEQTMKDGFVALRWTYVDANKNLVPATLNLTLVHLDKKGQPIIVASVYDLRSKERAREAVSQQQEQLQNILDSTPITMMILINGVVQTINDHGNALLGLNPGDDTSRMYNNEADRDTAFKILQHSKKLDNRPMKLKDQSGHLYDTLVSLRNIVHDGKKACLVWIIDITELSRARQAAEAAAHAKSDFLASVSHEIRTPMNAIIGMSYLCMQTELLPHQKNYLSKIHGAATSLLAIINDILDFSKIEAGKMTLEDAPFRLADTLKSLWDIVAFKAEEKGILFSLDIDKNIPECLVGDSLRLNQILLNLCNNSIKFTEKGKIILQASSDDVETDAASQRHVRLHFSVQDTGIGMSPEQVERLFTPFTQADPSTTRKYGGSGLGLTICKHLIESMKGTIKVESVLGSGTTIHFSVQLGVGNATELTQQVSINVNGMRVLVVDDDYTSNEILREELNSLSMKSDVAMTGARALEKIRLAIENNTPYSFLILDWRMPGMDGEETVNRIKKDFPRENWPHMIMVSAYNDEECNRICKKLGIDCFLPKPVSRSDLYDAVVDTLSAEQQQISVSREKEALDKITLKGTVLLVEDNQINQEIAMEMLQQKGLKVEVANNGLEAIEAVKAKQYDLVLMDVQMPVMDGLEATRHIRELDGCSKDKLPIVAMTAHAMQGDYEKSIAAGMNNHITKPIDPQQLYTTLAYWLRDTHC